MKKLFSILMLYIFGVIGYAQDIEFIATAPGVVAQGEQFRLVYMLNSKPKQFNPPTIEGFYLLSGPNVSSSSSVQIINGRMTQTQEYTYTYFLEAEKEGNFTIPPATATIDKIDYASNPVSIQVVQGGSYNQPGRQQQGRVQSHQQEEAREPVNKQDEIFVDIAFDKTAVYHGEPILVTISIYTRQNIAGFEDVKFPSFTGFWSQEVETPTNVHFNRISIDGRIYNEGVLKKYLLFPQKAGELTIEPFEIVVLTQERSGRGQSIFDDFFATYHTVKQRLATPEKIIKVKELPTPSPASFTGAVGSFNFEATLDKEEVKTNEAINLKVRVSGSGNLRLINAPKVEFPPGFEVFDTKTTDKISTTKKGATGAKEFDIVAIPRAPGQFELGPLEFTYFNPVQQKYITLTSKPLAINVEPDENDYMGIPMTGIGREDIRFIGKDIRFIKTQWELPHKNGVFLVASFKYKLIILILLLLFVAVFWWIHTRRSFAANIALVRIRKANRVAKQRLKKAAAYLSANRAEEFYEELLRALMGYVSDKLNIPVADLSSQSMGDALTERGVPTEDVQEFLRLVAEVEFARYAPKGEHSQMAGLYDSSVAVLAKFDAVLNY